MDAELKQKWISDLRSGKFAQTTGRLTRAIHHHSRPYGYCCLGVYCISSGFEELPPGGANMATYDGSFRMPDGDVQTHSLPKEMIPEEIQEILVGMNDEGKTFAEIADWVEENM